MQHWTERTWLGFDTETTGTSVGKDYVLTSSLVSYDPRAAQTIGVDNSVINPGVAIPQRSIDVHGLTQEFIEANGKEPHEELDRIAERLARSAGEGHVLVAFNAGFDFAMLDNNLRRLGLKPLQERMDASATLIVDPLVLDRHLWKYRRGKRRLENLIEVYGVKLPDGGLHDAQVDTQATLGVLVEQTKRFDQLKQMDEAQMMAFQREAHAAWAEDFEQFLASRGSSTRIGRIWIDVPGFAQ